MNSQPNQQTVSSESVSKQGSEHVTVRPWPNLLAKFWAK